MAQRIVALAFVFIHVSRSASESGFIQRSSDGNFLTCTTSACTWRETPTQVFRKAQGHNGQSRFHILQADGTDTRQCLDRMSCHHGSSMARMGSCNHCGAYHWGYDGSQLAEDHMKNCIQSDAKINHCSQGHAAIKWPVEQKCKPIMTTISDLKCKNQESGGTCGANFEKDSTTGAHSDHDCDACDAAAGSSLGCDFSFSVSTQHTVSTKFSSSTAIMAGTEFTVGMSFISKAEGTVKFSVTETLTYEHDKSTSTTSTITGGCEATIKAGTKESAVANYFAGTLIGEFTAKVTTTYDCPWLPTNVSDTTGTITISNVPTQSIVGTCKCTAGQCPKESGHPELFHV